MSLGEHFDLACLVLQVGLIALVFFRYKAERDADEEELLDELETAEQGPTMRVQRFSLVELKNGSVEVAMTLAPKEWVRVSGGSVGWAGENEPYRMSPAEVAQAKGASQVAE